LANAQTPSFTLIQPPPISDETIMWGMSSDGTTVVGNSASPQSAFSWSAAGGRIDIGLQSGLSERSIAYAASNLGAVVVGASGPGLNDKKAFQYRNGVYQSLQTPTNYLRSNAFGVSGNGSLIVGSSVRVAGESIPTIWNAAGVRQELSYPRPGDSSAALLGVSRDGSTAFGQALGGSSNGFDAVTWSPTGGWQVLPAVPGVQGPYSARPWGCSADGRFIAGNCVPDFGLNSAAIWADGVAARLPDFQADFGIRASSVTDDGRLIVGDSSRFENSTAILWIDRQSPILLRDYLQQRGVIVPNDWTLMTCDGVSGDGRTFAGRAQGPNGITELTFVATIPQPGPLVLAGVTGSALAFRRRRGVR
jgi:uncharacterized membrane protein